MKSRCSTNGNLPLITGPYAQALKDGRASFNARFAEARRTQPRLDPHEFADTLRTIVAAILSATERVEPARTAEIVNVLYDLSLDLLAREFIGPRSRYPYINAGWRELLPALGPHIVDSPRAVVGSITNALYNLSVEPGGTRLQAAPTPVQWAGSPQPGARPQEWLDSMRALAPLCADVPMLLQVGQVAAWRAGLAHYRQGALALCRRLALPLALAALGVPTGSGSDPDGGRPPVVRAAVAETASLRPDDLNTLLERLAADPWLRPADALIANRPRELRIVARAGAFRGFGGLFMAPPVVTASGEHFVALSPRPFLPMGAGEARWLLTADVFGATFHRAGDGPTATGSGAFQLDRSGRVTLGKDSKVFPELADFSSAAGNDRTLAVTTPLSHAVYLVALA